MDLGVDVLVGHGIMWLHDMWRAVRPYGDAVNTAFEFIGGLVVAGTVLRVLRERLVIGVPWQMPAFFWTWGLWNLFYYPSLEQWISAAAGVSVFAANTAWLALVLRYGQRKGKNVEPN